MAAPTKCTPERINQISQAVAAGAYAKSAAAMAGITERTYYNWIDWGRREQEPYFTFYKAMQEAEAQAEVANIAIVRSAAQDGTWQAAAWYLERKHPERWGRRDRVTTEMTARVSLTDPKAALLAALEAAAAPLDDEKGDDE